MIERLAIRPMIGKPLFSVAVITLGLEIVLRVIANDTVKNGPRPLQRPLGCPGVHDRWRPDQLVVHHRDVRRRRRRSWPCSSSTARGWASRCERSPATRRRRWRRASTIGRVFAIAWGAGAVLAALGGVFATSPPIAQTGAVDTAVALVAFRALPAVILGGLDSVQGALVGGLLVGIAEIFAGQYLSRPDRLARLRLPADRALRRDDHRPARQTVRPVRNPRDSEGVSDVPPTQSLHLVRAGDPDPADLDQEGARRCWRSSRCS